VDLPGHGLLIWGSFYVFFLFGKIDSTIDWINGYMSNLGSQIVRVVT